MGRAALTQLQLGLGAVQSAARRATSARSWPRVKPAQAAPRRRCSRKNRLQSIKAVLVATLG